MPEAQRTLIGKGPLGMQSILLNNHFITQQMNDLKK